jgi:hypothetical protein
MMSVFGHPEKEEVHVGMLFLSADSPARLKTMGFTSMNSDETMCYVCPAKFSSLVSPECFDLNSKSFMSAHSWVDMFTRVLLVVTVDVHDPWKQLRYKFLSARTMDEDYRQLIAEKKGVRASSFDILAGVHPITASPPGLMHAAFLCKCFVFGNQPMAHLMLVGMMSVVHRDILHKGGMFNIKSRKKSAVSPIERFDGFLETLWWPGDSGRVKTRVSRRFLWCGA